MVLHNGPPCTGTSHGAIAGAAGQLLYNFVLSVPGAMPNLGADTAICTGQMISLALDTVFANYLWNTGATTATIQVNNPGIYFVDVPSGCGFVRDSIVVSLNTISLNLGPDLAICQGDSILLQLNGNYASQLWSNGSILPTVTVSTAGQYFASVFDQNGCSDADTIGLSILPLFNTFIVDSFCVGTTFNFNGTILSGAGTYLDSLQTQNGCDSIIHLTLSTLSLPLITVNNASICEGESATLIPLGALNYIWTPAITQNLDGSILVAPSSTTLYQVVGINQNACVSLPQNATVTVYPNPLADFYFSPQVISMGDPTGHIINSSLGADSYTWSIGGLSFIENQLEFDYTFPFSEGSQSVSLVAESVFGCLDSINNSIQITNDFAVYVPNTFTPDGDEHNHVFQPIFSGEVDPASYGFWIYNRWGELIFESHDIHAYWDGNYGDCKAQVGVYSFILSYSASASPDLKTFTGSVSLLR
jgi:gliding motility-associated-like protein